MTVLNHLKQVNIIIHIYTHIYVINLWSSFKILVIIALVAFINFKWKIIVVQGRKAIAQLVGNVI